MVVRNLRRVTAQLNPRNFNGRQRYLRLFGLYLMLGVLLFGVTQPIISNYLVQQRYKLSASTRKIVSHTNANLKSKFSYDENYAAFVFNQTGLEATPQAAKSGPDPVAALKKMKAKIGDGGKKADVLYSAKVPVDASKGVTYYDNNSSLNFTLVPQFKQLSAKQVDGQIIYPAEQGIQTVFSAKLNGLKEDIVLNKAIGDSATYSYNLQLSNELEARLTDDGGLGVYSADPSLFGNISYATSDDEARVKNARTEGKKDHLVFALPAPTIVQSGKNNAVKAKAVFTLVDNVLTVKAEGLAQLNYPISIDPTVVITSTTDFATGNNEDNSINFGTAGQIARGGLTGGSSSVHATTTAFTNRRAGLSSFVYNGYIYLLGGYNDVTATYYNDVQYAPLNADGTVGTWQYTYNSASGASFAGGFTNVRTRLTSVVYNGYVYVMGGGGAGATYFNDVQYAPLNANGTIGTWNPTTAFTTPRSGHSSVVYNGYIYVMGGSNGTPTYFNDVQYAPINANGTIGTWNTTTAFTTARSGHTSVVYNGYVYVMGGGGAGATYFNDVQYAPLNANGTIGTWNTTTAFTSARNNFSSVVANGYICILGGQDGTPTYYNDVQYAPINANGTVGIWTSTNGLTIGKQLTAAATSGGYLYLLGGTRLSGPSTVVYNLVEYAKIDPAGITTAYRTETNSPATARAWGSGVAYNGYLYIVGGCTAISTNTCSTVSSVISYAAINNDGTLSAWADTTTVLPAARGIGSAIAYNGYLYYIAGRPSSTTVSAAVYYAQIGTTGNITTAFTTISAPTGLSLRYGQATAMYNGYIYVTGGCTTASGSCSTYLSTTDYAVLSPTGGFSTNPSCGNNFCPLNSFTTARYGHAAAISGSTIYISGGTHATSDTACNTTASNDCSDVQYATISSTGTLSAWSATNSFTNARFGHAFYAANGYLYVSSGKTTAGTFLNDTTYAKLNANGTVAADSGCGSAWCTSSTVTVARSGSASAVYRGALYHVSGQTTATAVSAAVYDATVNNGGLGNTGTWATTTAFTTSRTAHTSVAYNGYLYVIGGTGAAKYNDVQYAPINANGTIGAWTATTSFTTARYSHTSVVYNGYIYVIGGATPTNLNDVQYAPINANGTIGAWTATTSFTTGRNGHTSVAYNGYLYVIGGSNGSDLSDVQYAPINANGTIGAWTATTSFTTGRSGHTSVVYNGYLYVMGGTDSFAATFYDDVQYAPINANGTIGIWASTTSLVKGRFGHQTVVYNGYMYITGGNGTGGVFNDAQYAPIGPNGTIGTWAITTSFTTARNGHTTVFYNGYLYVVGGNSGSSVYYSDVQYTPISVIQRSTRYSKLIDFGTTTTVSNISYTGTTANGIKSINYKLAGIDGVFSGDQPASALTGNCPAGGTTRYVLLDLILDDSAADAVFPDAVQANVQDITINYASAGGGGGVLPVQRLSHGKTLQQSSGLQPLDTSKVYPSGGVVCT